MIRKQAGFTLLEVLVAVAIFAIVGVMAAVSLHQMILSHDGLQKNDMRWQQLIIAQRLLLQDFSHVSPQQAMDDHQALLPLLVVSKESVQFATTSLESTNTLSDVFAPKKVIYTLTGSELRRTSVPLADNDLSSSRGELILEHIDSMTWSFFYDGKWTDAWSFVNKLPQALKISATVDQLGSFDWVIPIAGAYAADKQTT